MRAESFITVKSSLANRIEVSSLVQYGLPCRRPHAGRVEEFRPAWLRSVFNPIVKLKRLGVAERSNVPVFAVTSSSV